MDVSYPGFGTIEVEGTRYDHDVVVEAGHVRPRNKQPSKRHKAQFHHTPLSIGEDIPWSASRLVVGTGSGGRLPIMPQVWEEAGRRGIELVALPTEEACRLLSPLEPADVYAILHVTC
jgi:hypothetical protein